MKLTPPELHTLTQTNCLPPLHLRFFDVEARIAADSAHYLALFQAMYHRFQAPPGAPRARTLLDFVILTQPTPPLSQSAIIINSQVHLIKPAQLSDGHVYETIFHTLIAQVSSHFLIHAGVVAHREQGIILSADSGHGKTTLILELVRRGFKFLSDEMAALGRADRCVYPFPRSLRIRPGTLERVGYVSAGIGAPVWLNKLILDIEAIQPGSLGARVPVSHIIILRDPADPRRLEVDRTERTLNILVDRVDDALLAALRRIAGINDVQTIDGQGYATLTIRAAHPTQLLPQIENECHTHSTIIYEVSKQPDRRPRFDLPVRLEPITPHQATLELVRRFQGGHQSALLQNEFGGSATRLFLELADLISGAQCHQLFVGPLAQMADAVCALVE